MICLAALIPRVFLHQNILITVHWSRPYSHNIRGIICKSNGTVALREDIVVSGRSVLCTVARTCA